MKMTKILLMLMGMLMAGLLISACNDKGGYDNYAYWGAPPTVTHELDGDYEYCIDCHESGEEIEGKISTKFAEDHDPKKGHMNCLQCHASEAKEITVYKKNNF
ncbi:MAG: hypothetical protein OEZ22_06490 [Spirochaetia bacterium]|nr:hypothetical protein [Spirochaetia bacterium]